MNNAASLVILNDPTDRRGQMPMPSAGAWTIPAAAPARGRTVRGASDRSPSRKWRRWLCAGALAAWSAGAAQAATYTWDGGAGAAGGWYRWSNAVNWAGNTLPAFDGTDDIVLAAGSTGDWLWLGGTRNINSLTYGGAPTKYLDGGTLNLGAGGFTGSATWLYTYGTWNFTAGSYIRGRALAYQTVSASAANTIVHLQLVDFRTQNGFNTTGNVKYYLESGEPAIYTDSNYDKAMGANKIYVTLTNLTVNPAAVRGIGNYGGTASNHLYFTTPIEFDAASMNTGARRFNLNTQKTPSGSSLIQHFSGNWTMTNGAAITNTSGLGWLWLNGGGGSANLLNKKNYYEMDSRTIVTPAVSDSVWAGDVFVYQGIHVINAPHAFKTNNSAFFNLGGASGGSTTGSNSWLLATHGNNVSGNIRITAGDSIGETRRSAHTVGIEGTGTVTFTGKILMDGWSTANTLRAGNLELYAGANGNAIFQGAMAQSVVNGTAAYGTVTVLGGGQVTISGHSSLTNTTTVTGNTTLRLDGTLNTATLMVRSGARIQGTGTITNDLAVFGTAAPGNGIGSLTVRANAVFQPGASWEVELSTAGATGDSLVVLGSLDVSGAILKLVGGQAGARYAIAACGTLSGSPCAALDTSRLAPGLRVQVSQVDYRSTGIVVRVASTNDLDLLYSAGAHGTLLGETAQWIPAGGSGSPVTAVPDANCRFLQWSDGSTQNPRIDSNVMAAVTVQASFEPLPGYLSLAYGAGPGGSVSGAAAQIVAQGASGAPVTAVPALGYRFAQWSDGRTQNPRTDTNVAAHVSVTAQFALNQYTLTYTAGANGTLSGATSQNVQHGGNGTPVTAVANTNCHFSQWSDGVATATRTDLNVTNHLSVTANFALDTYTVIYLAGANGKITGVATQTVAHGTHSSPVTPTPNSGYKFHQWSDYRNSNPRTDYAVSNHITVTAYFGPEAPKGTATFVTNLLSKAAIPHPADPFIQIFAEPMTDAYNYGFQTHGNMTQPLWEAVLNHVGHLSTYALCNPYWPDIWTTNPWMANGLSAALAVGRKTGGGIASLPTNSVMEARIQTLYREPHGLAFSYYFQDSEEEMIDQVAGGGGDGRLRGTTTATNWTAEASMYTAASADFNCATNGRLRAFTLSFGLFLGNDMYGNWPYTKLAAVGTTTNGWRVDFKSTGWKGSNVVRFISYKNGVSEILESPPWSYADAQYWRTVTVTATTKPGDATKWDVEVKVECPAVGGVYARTGTVSRPNTAAAPQFTLLTMLAQNAATQMRDLDDVLLKDYTGATIVSYDFEPAVPGVVTSTVPIGTVADRSGLGHDLYTPAGWETNYTRRPTHGLSPELKSEMGKWMVDELLAARTSAGKPAPEVINNWRISETPGRLATWKTEGFTHGSTEAYWLNPTLGANENAIIWLAKRGSNPTRYAWADGSDWSHMWLGVETRTNAPPATAYDDLVTLQVLQGVRWFAVFTPMSFGHLGSQTMDFTDPIGMANINADSIYNMCLAASWFQPTSATLADSVLTAEKYGDATIGADTLYIRRDHAAAKQAWFAGLKVAGTGSYTVSLPTTQGRVRNLKTGAETAVTNGLFNLPLTQSAEPYHFRAECVLTYAAGAGGSISGTSPQTVGYGADGSQVTAVANTGYHFVNWSDSSTQNPRTDTNVTAHVSVTANFAVNEYTLTYTAGANGSVTGTSPQTVNHGADGSLVTAGADTGYHFVNWSDGSTQNPRTDTNVTANVAVTANFAINEYTLTYTAGANGTLTGATSQNVQHGGIGTAVTAGADTGYHFVNWSDSSTQNPRTDLGVMGDVTVAAGFAINEYTLTYTAGANGTLTGATSQNVQHGGNGTPVTAVPNTGYYFTQWSDNSAANPRTDLGVTGDVTVAAGFALQPAVSIARENGQVVVSWEIPDPAWGLERGPAWTPIPPEDYVTNGIRVLYAVPFTNGLYWFRLSRP